MKSLKSTIITVFSALCLNALSACNKVPDYVIQPEEMAQLMADIHTGESVVEMNRTQFYSDSLKLLFKQSIYKKHNVTPQQVDTSFVWYGHHIDKYMEVYDRTIEILETRLNEKGSMIAAEAAASVSGDSVDVWTSDRYMKFDTRLMPSSYVTFNLKRDQNWEVGDSYTWRAKFAYNGRGSSWMILADYDDGSTEYLNGMITKDGWNEITLYSDSTRTLRRVYGNLEIVPADDQSSEVWIDSISMIRNRVNRLNYPQRARQRSVTIR